MPFSNLSIGETTSSGTASTSTSIFTPSPELRKTKSWIFNSLRVKKSNKNLCAGSGANDESKYPSLPTSLPKSSSSASFLPMDGIIDPAIPSNDASSPTSGFTAPESWSVVVEDGKDPVGRAESRLDDSTGGNGRTAAQHKIQIRIYKADNTYHVTSVSVNATVAALTWRLDQMLPAGEEREMHQLYLKERGWGQGILAQTERPADIVRRRLEQAGYNETDGRDLLGSAGLSFLLKFEEDLKVDNFSDIDLTNRSLRTIPVALYKHADSIVSLRLSRNPMLEIPLDFIQSCTTLRELRLSHMGMKQPPRSLRHSATLTCLNLSCNRIVTLDEAYFDDIPKLIRLHVQNNRLEKLPWSFPRLRGLVALNLSNNKFRTFPAAVGQLLNLCDLDISFNMISELPEEIGELRNLERLVIVGNQVSRLPEEFSSLGRLEVLDCRRNQISDLKVACMLPKIKTLTADHNALHNLSLSMGPCLMTLDVSHNEIRQLTPVLRLVGGSPLAVTSLDISNAKLSWLKTLSCTNNALRELPQSIGKLQKLETLDVRNNSLTELPISLWNCASLVQLNVTSNLLVLWHDPPFTCPDDDLASFSDNTAVPGAPAFPSNRKPSTSAISETPPLTHSLELLYLGGNSFTYEELRVLNLSYNNIRDLPSNFFENLTKLEEVYLSGNHLTSFPCEDLPKLTRLSTLFLNGNRLRTLPEELGKVTSLTVVDVGSNELKYNINNWEFDWNWNFNKIGFSIPGQHQRMPTVNWESLAGFSELSQLRVLGLMDVTIPTMGTNTDGIPDENNDRRVRTSEERASQYTGSRTRVSRHEEEHRVCHVRLRAAAQAIAPRVVSNRLAKYLQENFVRVFVSQMNSLHPECNEGIPDALRRSFLVLNRELHDTFVTRRTISALADPSPIVRNGASGIVVYIVDKKMYVANVGDALAIVSKGGTAVPVSRKHDPYDRAETARIRAAEGWISPPGLLSDEIDISRSFGFYHLLPIVNARPDIFTYDLTELDEFVIIANRGLWDYVPYQSAIDIAQRSEPMVAAQKLRDFAISYGADGSIMIMVIGVADLFKGNFERETSDAHKQRHPYSAARSTTVTSSSVPDGSPIDYINSLLILWKRRESLSSQTDRSDHDMTRENFESQIVMYLADILDSRGAWHSALLLQGQNAQAFLDAMQHVINRGSLPTPTYTSMARKLMQKLSEAYDQLPSSLFINGVHDPDKDPTFAGGFGDVYHASYRGERVALKHIRTFKDESRKPKNFAGKPSPSYFPSSFCLVSPWMKHGTILKFLSDRGRGEILRLTLEITQGLDYLHSMNIVHGDLRGANILISDEYHACLSDFGLATTIQEGNSDTTYGSLCPAPATPAMTRSTDVYAFAIYQMETGAPPFADVPEVSAMFKILAGERPERPKAMSDGMWDLVNAAWAEDFRKRPNTAQVIWSLEDRNLKGWSAGDVCV
ncbi:hypothetical protein B0H13DRAFT_2315167 [Mycena leptocephala]|nr:hypothetical protein B0H13DRAFT_2315167 [Mycena leptocephala]